MDRIAIEANLTEIISEVIPNIDEEISYTASIKDSYGVNSVSIIRIIVATESKFDISFTDYELALSSYDTFGDLVATIAEKLANKE